MVPFPIHLIMTGLSTFHPTLQYSLPSLPQSTWLNTSLTSTQTSPSSTQTSPFSTKTSQTSTKTSQTSSKIPPNLSTTSNHHPPPPPLTLTSSLLLRYGSWKRRWLSCKRQARRRREPGTASWRWPGLSWRERRGGWQRRERCSRSSCGGRGRWLSRRGSCWTTSGRSTSGGWRRTRGSSRSSRRSSRWRGQRL